MNILELPNEVLAEIFSFLPHCRHSRTCDTFHQVEQDMTSLRIQQCSDIDVIDLIENDQIERALMTVHLLRQNLVIFHMKEVSNDRLFSIFKKLMKLKHFSLLDNIYLLYPSTRDVLKTANNKRTEIRSYLCSLVALDKVEQIEYISSRFKELDCLILYAISTTGLGMLVDNAHWRKNEHLNRTKIKHYLLSKNMVDTLQLLDL